MKIYAKNANIRKPMMYGGMTSTPIMNSMGAMSAPVGQGMMKDKKIKNTMAAMKKGGRIKKY